MKKDIAQIGFLPDPKTELLIEREQERLAAHAHGTPVTRAAAVRSLICKTSALVEKPAS